MKHWYKEVRKTVFSTGDQKYEEKEMYKYSIKAIIICSTREKCYSFINELKYGAAWSEGKGKIKNKLKCIIYLYQIPKNVIIMYGKHILIKNRHNKYKCMDFNEKFCTDTNVI